MIDDGRYDFESLVALRWERGVEQPGAESADLEASEQWIATE
jgi:hypothetical protein